MFRNVILPVFVLVFIVVAFSVLATGVTLFDMSNDCAADGGTFSIEGATAWCRY